MLSNKINALVFLQPLSVALFRLEASCKPAEVMRIVHTLLDWLKAPEQAGLWRAFTI
jgi:hypothetical protein